MAQFQLLFVAATTSSLFLAIDFVVRALIRNLRSVRLNAAFEDGRIAAGLVLRTERSALAVAYTHDCA